MWGITRRARSGQTSSASWPTNRTSVHVALSPERIRRRAIRPPRGGGAAVPRGRMVQRCHDRLLHSERHVGSEGWECRTLSRSLRRHLSGQRKHWPPSSRRFRRSVFCNPRGATGYLLLPILVFVPVAGVVAAKRTPTYTAEARLMVGRLNISTPGAVQGFATAAQDLASTYPLVIDADGVVNPVARQLRTTPADVRSRLSASGAEQRDRSRDRDWIEREQCDRARERRQQLARLIPDEVQPGQPGCCSPADAAPRCGARLSAGLCRARRGACQPAIDAVGATDRRIRSSPRPQMRRRSNSTAWPPTIRMCCRRRRSRRCFSPSCTRIPPAVIERASWRSRSSSRSCADCSWAWALPRCAQTGWRDR